MKNFILILFMSFVIYSCQKKHYNQTYISSYMIDSNGQTKAPNYSLIQLKNDSLFFKNLLYSKRDSFIGIKPINSNNFISRGLDFKFDNNELKLTKENMQIVYKSLKFSKSPANINASNFEGKEFSINSELVTDTIFFVNSNNYKNFSKNHLNRWLFTDYNGIKILWITYKYEEVPLVIESIDDKGINTHLYALKNEKVRFKKLKS